MRILSRAVRDQYDSRSWRTTAIAQSSHPQGITRPSDIRRAGSFTRRSAAAPTLHVPSGKRKLDAYRTNPHPSPPPKSHLLSTLFRPRPTTNQPLTLHQRRSILAQIRLIILKHGLFKCCPLFMSRQNLINRLFKPVKRSREERNEVLRKGNGCGAS